MVHRGPPSFATRCHNPWVATSGPMPATTTRPAGPARAVDRYGREPARTSAHCPGHRLGVNLCPSQGELRAARVKKSFSVLKKLEQSC